jgi:putative drug exporter of the RND superfamily
MAGELNLSGRAGRWAAGHWKTAVLGWLALALTAMAVGSVVGHVQMRDSQAAAGETARALSMLDRAGMKQPAIENVLIQNSTLTTSDELFQSAVAGVVQALDGQPNVTNIQTPCSGSAEAARSHGMVTRL